MKPWSSIVDIENEIVIPAEHGEVHHELEIAFVIDQVLENASEAAATRAICGIGLALDLTLRDVQASLKGNGYPWDKSKGFDKSCPIKCIPTKTSDIDFDDISIKLLKNQELQQQGNCSEMIFKILPLISYMSSWFTLNPGDVILTGTPAGVSALNNDDQLHAELAVAGQPILRIDTSVASEISLTI
jgi:2-keto-4-pentenoate hydratase/2-oxohepta-3-ene-1,7-dioic acid hydratase in catechol pathway